MTVVAAIDIHDLQEFEGSWFGWWTKGHHDPADFLSAISQFEHPRCIVGINETCVRKTHYRCVPIKDEVGGAFSLIETTPGRGAFPVTILEAPKSREAHISSRMKRSRR